MSGICRRKHDDVEDGRPSKSENVMNTAKPMYEWKDIPWRKLEKSVFKLQKRIYQASSRGEVNVVRRLQRLLMKSWGAKCLAVRKVTQDNRGKNTAGIDGIASLTPNQRLNLAEKLELTDKAKPTRRVWIPKPGKMEKRPLGIPMMCSYCTLMQGSLGQGAGRRAQGVREQGVTPSTHEGLGRR